MLLSISFLIFVLWIQTKAQIYVSGKASNDTPLFDQLHRNEKYLKYYNISDHFIHFYILTLFYYHDHIDDFLNMLSLVYLLRTIFFTITILPKCGKMKNKTETSFYEILYNHITLKETHSGYNNDLFFSGHTSFMYLYNLYLVHFNYIEFNTGVLLFGLNLFLSILNILSRCHYSICILGAYCMTTLIYQNYFIVKNYLLKTDF